MATNDSTLNVQVVTTADLSGVQQVKAEVGAMQGEVQKTTAAVQATNAAVVEQKSAFELTRAEAAALSREIAEGAISARTLGTSLAGFGNQVAIAAIAVYTIGRIIYDNVKAEQQFEESVAKANDELQRTVANFQRMAEATTTFHA